MKANMRSESRGVIELEKADSYTKPMQRVLSQLFATRLKAQVYHWNARGPQFYSAHKLLEDVYKNLDESIDEVAERIRTLGIHTISSFEEIIQFCGTSNLKSDKFMGLDEMIVDMNKSLESLGKVISDVLKQENLNCRVTEDLLIKTLGRVEKYAWMIRSFEKESE